MNMHGKVQENGKYVKRRKKYVIYQVQAPYAITL